MACGSSCKDKSDQVDRCKQIDDHGRDLHRGAGGTHTGLGDRQTLSNAAESDLPEVVESEKGIHGKDRVDEQEPVARRPYQGSTGAPSAVSAKNTCSPSGSYT